MENKVCEWVGSDCGHHASYIFYKGIKYLVNPRQQQDPDNGAAADARTSAAAAGAADEPRNTTDKWKVLTIGQFFFVKIWGDSDLVSVAEIQLLWEDKTTSQKMASVRLYFLPEFTAEGRLPHHGEDEMVAVAEKAVLRVVDLLDWMVPLTSINWERGAKGVAHKDCPGENKTESSTSRLDLSEVDKIREEIGDDDIEEKGIVVVSAPQYYRYRSIMKRLEGVEDKWMKNSLVLALGGFTTKTRRTAVMFAKEIFDYPELEEHPQLCNHLAPKLKGRPRKRRKNEESSPEGSDPDSNSCDTPIPNNKVNGKDLVAPRPGARKDLLNILSQKNTKEEISFLKRLIKFMESRGTPIERPPMLGFKQIDLHFFFNKVDELGGYDGCVTKKAWKSVYDDLGGNPQNTSAATCTRRHYERYLLPYEKHLKSEDNKEDITLDETSGNLVNGSDQAEEKPAEKSAESPTKESPPPKVEEKEKKETKPYLGLKPLQLLTEPSLHHKKEEEENKLKIDDLIIIPNNLNHQLEEGGSALQNLAKIASRYSSLNKDKSRAQEFTSPGPKKPRIEEKPGVAQPLPPTTLSKKPPSVPSHSPLMDPKNSSAATASALLQQFSLLSPGLFGSAWPAAAAGASHSTGSSPSPKSGSSSAASSSNNSSSWLSSLHIDANKIGQEGYNLLKYYEQQLKALQQGAQPSTVSKVNGVKEPSSKSKEPKGGKEKNKVCKPPPDTKKPPKLLQSPCPFLQTSNIYGSPKVDLMKAKESSSKKDVGNNSEVEESPNQVLDLTSGSNMEFRTISPHRPIASQNSSTGNVPRSEAPKEPVITPTEDKTGKSHHEVSLDLSTGGRSHTPRSDNSSSAKMSPFSAEALLSRPSSRKNESPKSFPPLSMGIKGILEPERSTPQSSSGSSSPWQQPPASSKPAAPVPPVVRSTASPYFGVSLPSTLSQIPGLSTETTFSSLSSLPSSSLQPSVPTPTSNPYLQALMSPLHKPSVPGFPGMNPMDPLSQYYAALYSQQLSAYNAAALNPYAAAAGMGMHAGLGASGSIPGLSAAASGVHGLGASTPAIPGLTGLGGAAGTLAGLAGAAGLAGGLHGLPPASASSIPAAGSGMTSVAGGGGLSRSGFMPGTASAELQALQAYKDLMNRSALSSAAPPSPMPTSSTANPYAALYAGLMGYPGFPRKDS